VDAGALFVRRDGGVRAPWRIAFFAAATFAGGLLVAGIVYPLLALTPMVDLARAWRLPLDEVGTVVALLVGTVTALHAMDRSPLDAWARVGLHRGALGWRGLLAGLAAGSLAILIPSALLVAAGRLRLEPQPAAESWTATAAMAIVMLAPSAFAEELAMRGYLFTVLRDAIRAPGAIAVTSVIFALLHLYNPGPTILSTAMVTLAGVFLASVRLATGSLYAAFVAHLAWNFVQAAVLHAPVSGLSLPAPGYRAVDAGPVWLTGGAWGPEGGLAAAAGMLVASFLLLRRPRNARQARNGEASGFRDESRRGDA
jgi:membrane protease YdiL (CAAX protease family)